MRKYLTTSLWEKQMRKYLITSFWEKKREAACIKKNERFEAVCTCRGKNKKRNNKDMEGKQHSSSSFDPYTYKKIK
jgi:hypothetical protein